MMSYHDTATVTRFPDFLREGRKTAGKTQQDVANHLGVVQSAVSAWEIGRASMPMSVFFKLVKFLDLDLAKAMSCFVENEPGDVADSSTAVRRSAVEGSTRTAGSSPLTTPTPARSSTS